MQQIKKKRFFVWKLLKFAKKEIFCMEIFEIFAQKRKVFCMEFFEICAPKRLQNTNNFLVWNLKNFLQIC
jgi:hypothetical protein